MRYLRCSIIFFLLQLGFVGGVRAQVASMTVSGDPAPLTVRTAVAGQSPDPVSDGGTTYSLTDISETSKITAQLDSSLPPGVTLTVTLQAPLGATSMGPIVLSTTTQDVVIGILPASSYSGLTITYELSATTAGGVVAPLARSVTFAIVSQL
jgi:hypothetical protein